MSKVGFGRAAKQSGFGRAANQAGFGLVELMVSLTLGLVVVGGATVLLLSTRQSNGSTDSLSRMAESVRTSYDLMVREVREAGATPCDSQVLVSDVLTNAQGLTPTWWATWSDPLHGFDGTDAFDGAAFGTATAQRINGTAALAVRYGTAIDNLAVSNHATGSATVTTNIANHGIAAGDVLMMCNYKQGAIFQVTAANTATGTFVHDTSAATPGNCSKGLGFPTVCTSTGTTLKFSAGSLIGRYTGVGWYIGANGRANTGGRSLFRVTRLGAEEVAEGVRDMQLRYLVASGTSYVTAASVTDWNTVTAVRFDLSYESADASVSTATAGARLTRPVSFTVNIRNLQP